MRYDEPIPPEWGRTTFLRVANRDGWETDGWYGCTFAPEGKTRHHGSRGSIPADTVAILVDDEILAVGDTTGIVLENLYAYDAEYYQVVRVRQVLVPDAWAALPWGGFGPGSIVFAWDKFHWLEYIRGADDSQMSYGGDWEHLESLICKVLGGSSAPRRSSPAFLLDAVRADDVAEVRACLAAGADPNGEPVPSSSPGVQMGVSAPRIDTPLWVAVTGGSAEVTAALLGAGANPDGRPPGGYTPLMGALQDRRIAIAALLLDAGADLALHRAWAAASGAETLAALEAAVVARAR